MENIENNVTELNTAELEEVTGGKKTKKHVPAGGLEKRPPDKPGYIVHKITATDTLTRIAKKYNTTIDAIMACNASIKDKNLIRTGYYIYVPSK